MLGDASVSHVLRNFIFFGFEKDFLLGYVVKDSTDSVHRVGEHSARNNSHQNAVHFLPPRHRHYVAVAYRDHSDKRHINGVQVLDEPLGVSHFLDVQPSVSCEIVLFLEKSQVDVPASKQVSYQKYQNDQIETIPLGLKALLKLKFFV